MALIDENELRSLIGNPTARQIEDNQLDIEKEIAKAESMVYTVTRKDDWIAPDPLNNIEGDFGYEWVVEAATKLAASRLITQFYDPKDKSKTFREEFQFAIDTLRRTGAGGKKDSGNPLFTIAVGSFKRDIKEDEPYMSKGVFGENYFKDRTTTGEFTIDDF